MIDAPSPPITADSDIAEPILPFPVVGIGASAGGLEAFTQLLETLPADTGMAYVLVQHLDPTHTSALPALLGQSSRMPVHEVRNGIRLEPNHVYVIPPNTSMTMVDGHLRLTARETGRGVPMPVNDLFRSLAERQGPRAIGIVLSGTASDGASGLEAIKGAGGITFAQTAATAKFGGMPGSAIATGCVDFVLSPADISHELARISGHHYLLRSDGDRATEAEPEGEARDLAGILSALRRSCGVDFGQYKTATLRRRIRRRMMLQHLDRIDDYTRTVQRDPVEAEALCQDLLIRVTNFFRDPATFEALKQAVFPDFVRGRPRDVPIRVWVPGCATGEEAYSLAICLAEFFDGLFEAPPVQLYATDVSETAVQKARAGLYLDSIAADVSPERLRRFFVREEGGYRVSSTIRDVCVFAKQDLTQDPPFSQIDLISCRNVLIYLTQPLQKRVFSLLHYALRPNGVLLLGGTESVGAFPELFTPADKKHRIFRKAAAPPGLLHFDMLTGRRAPAQPGHAKMPVPEVSTLRDLQKEADRVLLAALAPVGVVVNAQLDVIQFRGRTSAFLEPPPGAASFHLLRMVKPEFASGLRAAVEESRLNGQPALRRGIRSVIEGRPTRVAIEVIPFTAVPSGERFFVILFTPEEAFRSGRRAAPAAAAPVAQGSGQSARRARELEQELISTKEYMQAIVEEQEATNEELRSSTEEIQSSYEELQSSNEELETAKEELQSANEELTTVNEELHRRTLDLADANNDLTNFLASVNIPMVRIGNDMRIRRFTPNAERILNVIATDIGRPIRDLTLRVAIPDFEERVARVMDTLTAAEVEVQDVERRWWSVRIRPYRTSDHKIDGVVVAFVDIDSMNESSRTAQLARVRLEQIQSFAAALSRSMTPAQVAAVIVNSGRDAIGAAGAVLALREPGGSWEPFYATDISTEVVERLRAVSAQGGGPIWWVLSSSQAVALSSTGAIDSRFPEASDTLAQLGAHAYVAVPLETEGETIGALAFHFRAPRQFSEYDLGFLHVLAQLGALALRHAQQQSADRSVRDEVASARKGSDTMNRVTLELLSVVKEELGRSLGAVQGTNATPAAALQSGEDQTGARVERVAAGVAQASALVEQLMALLLVEGEDRRAAAQPANVREVLSDAVAAVASFAAARRVTLTARPPKRPITVETDAPKLRQAVASLVTAAIRLADHGDVALSARSDDAAVVIEVRAPTTAHTAPGLSRIFDSPQSDIPTAGAAWGDDASFDGASTWRVDGGVRLAFAVSRRLALHLGGTVGAEIGTDAGSVFSLRLPLRRLPPEALPVTE